MPDFNWENDYDGEIPLPSEIIMHAIKNAAAEFCLQVNPKRYSELVEAVRREEDNIMSYKNARENADGRFL